MLTGRGRYGHRRVHLLLAQAGWAVAKKTVLTLMRQLGLKCQVRRRRYNSYPGHEGASAPNVLQRRFQVPAPNQVWVSDVTEFALTGSKLYLSPVIDLHDHAVIAWSMSTSPSTAFTNASLRQAFDTLPAPAPGLMVHTDQGFQYRHRSWQALLARNHAVQSMSRKGNCYDNSLAENFFGHLKSEAFLEGMPTTIEDLTEQIDAYIHWYNHERIQERLEGLTPMQYRCQALGATALAAL